MVDDGGIVRAGLTAIGQPHLATTPIAREHPHIKPAPTPTSSLPHASVSPRPPASPTRTPTKASPQPAPPESVVDIHAALEPASETDS
ncbi:hypothetical protein AB0M38_07130 [Streptomyces sp. NPDC051742]|uniref:hypothetical protein n=1 Tax=unclassified Streptomyces TaxID=2593676 RepID=UPI0034248B6E